MVTAPSFPFRWLKQVAGIPRWPNSQPASPPERLTQPACVGHLRQCWTSLATRVGDESRKAPAKIHTSVQPSHARAFAGFREAITVRRTRSWPAPNIGSPTERRKEGVTTIPLRFPKTPCERFTFRHSKPQSMPASANPFTLTKVLRGEWKFEGFVVSDYTSVKELINHGVAADDKDAARAALNAGVDMEMVSRTFNQQGPSLLRERQLTQATIDEAVRRILRIKFRLGLFEHPYVDETLESSALLTSENRAAARAIADRSMVLLKNERETLPLSKAV